MYGQTEATARMSYLPFSNLEKKINSIGKAIPGGKFTLRNQFKDKRLMNKTIGELVYEGELEGADQISFTLINNSILKTFNDISQKLKS